MNLFVTVFLGLVVGSTTVEFQPPADTARLEVLLDGEQVAEISAAPWSVEVDLGARLRPHRLEAVALDSEGEVLARDQQWVNVPTGPARAGVDLLEGPRGLGLHLRWAHVLGYEPSQVRLTVDGSPVAVDEPAWVDLPPAESDLRLVRLEVEFPDFSVASADVVLRGGEMIHEDVELTAVPIDERNEDEIGKPLTGVRVDGAHPELLALERGPAQIVMVVDPAVMEEFGRRLDEAALERRENRAGQGIEFTEEVTVLEDEDWVKFVWPVAVRSHPTSEGRGIFDYSRDLTRVDGSLVEILRRTTPPMPMARSEVRLADSVAVAGLLAAARSRRRAVILVTEADPETERSVVSRFTPRQVQEFLDDLRVPLLVWTTGNESNTQWGRARALSSPRMTERAIDELRKIVDRQRIAWIGGLHLPQEVQVSARREIERGVD